VGALPLLLAQPTAIVSPRCGHREARLRALHRTRRTRYIDLIPFLCARRRSGPLFVRNTTRRNASGAPDADASKEEEGVAHVITDARDLCAWARVDDAEFKAVEGDGGGVKRGVAVVVVVRIRLSPPRSGAATATQWWRAQI
jgi:hypothetical protein